MAALHDDSSGQAAVEAALLLPLWILAILGTLQLALLQQARVLTEYAAYQAARAGIVWNGDPARMQEASIFVLAPTACPTRLPGVRALCKGAGGEGWGRQAASVAALYALSAEHLLAFPGVHVHILSPYWPKHAPLFDAGQGEELDFDRRDDAASERRAANLLTVQVQYWFELKIPFVDWVIWSSYLARQAGLSIRGDVADPVLGKNGDIGILARGIPEGRLAAALARSRPPAMSEMYRGEGYRPIAQRSWGAMIASGLGGGNRSQRAYFLPLVAHHTMRMQSNFFARHVKGCACSSGSGCTPSCRAW